MERFTKKQKEDQKSEQIQMSFEENKPVKETPTLFQNQLSRNMSLQMRMLHEKMILFWKQCRPMNQNLKRSKKSIRKNVFLKCIQLVKCMQLIFLRKMKNGLYIIDQHAAQERIKYEFYREKNWRS